MEDKEHKFCEPLDDAEDEGFGMVMPEHPGCGSSTAPPEGAEDLKLVGVVETLDTTCATSSELDWLPAAYKH